MDRDRPASGYDFDTLDDDLAAVIDNFDLRDTTLVGHSLGSRELVRYLTRHDARVARMVLVAPTTPQLRRPAENPGGWDPAIPGRQLRRGRSERPAVVHQL